MHELNSAKLVDKRMFYTTRLKCSFCIYDGDNLLFFIRFFYPVSLWFLAPIRFLHIEKFKRQREIVELWGKRNGFLLNKKMKWIRQYTFGKGTVHTSQGIRFGIF